MFQYSYDKLGRVTKRELGRTTSVKCPTETYCDSSPFLITSTDTVVTVGYHYDSFGRVDSLHWGGLPSRNGTSFAKRGFVFSYDSASRWIGTTSTVESGFTGSPYVLSQAYGEDDEVDAVNWSGDSRLAVYDTVDSPGWVDELRRDAAGRPRRRVNRDGIINLHYDGLGQLVLAGNEWFKYDTVGAGQLVNGRYQGAYGYNTLGQLTSRTPAQTYTYTYDLAGNRLTQFDSIGGNSKFTYNALDQQVSRRGYNPVTSTTSIVSAYYYDAMGRRVLESDSTPGKSGRVKRYYYEAAGPGAGELVFEQQNWQETPNLFKPSIRSATAATIYLRGPMGPNHLLMRFPDEDLTHEIFVHQDRQFSLMAESAPGGKPLMATSTYRAFGERIGSASESGQGYTGTKEAAGGLLFLRNRYYDPNSATFTQEDPIGLAGGTNLYAYADNDPVSNTDPFGLCPLEVDGVPCSVTMAVQGGVAGALAGSAIGAAGGTFVLPGVGTAAGALGGAAAGGLAGLEAGGVAGLVRDVNSVVEMSGLGNKIRSILTGILIGKGGGLSEEQERIRQGRIKPATEQTAPAPDKRRKPKTEGSDDDDPPEKTP